MWSLHNRGLLNDGNYHFFAFSPSETSLFLRFSSPHNHEGEYFVVGMDIEQYDASDPEKYLKGILHSEQEPWVGEAYQSYLAVLPSPLIGFDDFAKKVRRKSVCPPGQFVGLESFHVGAL